MGKSAVKVFIRTRPTSASSDHVRVEDKSVVVKLRKVDDGTVNNQLEKLSFKFEHILHGASQEQVFLQTAQEICDNSLMGYNGTVFAYGQTGSGKTYSMMGDTKSYDQRGVIPRALHYLFQEIEMREDREVTVRVSYLEIYNEELYDLLAENPGTADNLVIVEQNRSTFVKGLYQKPVANEEEALASFFEGESGRSVASHALNSNSSRSHVVFTVFLQTRSGADERVMSSKINFVDLAGSERTKKTNVDGQALKEAMYINKSLTFLEQTVHALSRKDAHIPFRQSKLTAVLRDSLGGNCKTVMIGNVWCEDHHLEECVSTLRFATRVKTLVTDFSINTSNDPTLLMRKYERQINDLKQELAMRNTLAGRARVSYEPMGDLEKMQLSESVKGFLKGDVALDSMPIESLQQVKEMFSQFKGLHEALEVAIATQSSNADPAGDAATGGAAVGGAKNEAGNAEVGDLGDATSFSVRVAPSHLRPEADDANLGAPQDAEDEVEDPGSLSPKKQTKQDSSGFQVFKRSIAGGRDLSAIFNS
jgi:kinesin family protein 6/9